MYNFFFKSINKCSSESKWNENKVDDENQWTEMVKLTHKIQQKKSHKKRKTKKSKREKKSVAYWMLLWNCFFTGIKCMLQARWPQILNVQQR